MLKKTVLRKKTDFDRLYKKGKSVGDRYVVVFTKKNGKDYNRIALLASKKVGNSVQRNRARRLMREGYRLLSADCKEGYDIIFVARSTVNGKKCKDVTSSMKSALTKLRVIESNI